METANELAVRLSDASEKKAWNVYSAFEWPEKLDESQWMMSPELVSLYGTDAWDGLSEAQQKKLSLHEVANLFSMTLNGERILIGNLSTKLYANTSTEITRFLHHFVAEENNHMVMFGMFCNRYTGGVPREKKLALPRQYEKGEQDVELFIMALVVEELGDVYNIEIGRDERVHPLVRAINNFHHRDEARHIAFGRVYLRELWEQWAPTWKPETVERFRNWVAEYLAGSWRDFYSPSIYAKAGVADPYAVRQAALASPVCRQHRERISRKLVNLLLDIGILHEQPAL